jgi:glycosyltransferase involved in cell wall biosynthesis
VSSLRGADEQYARRAGSDIERRGTPPMLAKPRVTAIVSAYKSERFIRGCLDDLEAQTMVRSLEIVVVDSASPERERDIVAEYAESYCNIVSVRTPLQETIYGSWNRAIAMARGEYITSANTDDRHRTDALEVMANALDDHPDVGLVYAGYKVATLENETFEGSTSLEEFMPAEYDAVMLRGGYCFPGPQPMWRRSLHERFGLFDEQFQSAGDLEFWLRIAAGTTFLRVPEILGLYLRHAASAEHRDPLVSQCEAREILARYAEGEGVL